MSALITPLTNTAEVVFSYCFVDTSPSSHGAGSGGEYPDAIQIYRHFYDFPNFDKLISLKIK